MKNMKEMSLNNVNFQKELEKIISSLENRPRLLLHSCCAPCSSYCLIYLLPHFDITCYYYNPNITDMDEYDKRFAELVRLAGAINEEYGSKIQVIDADHDQDKFLDAVKEGDLAGCAEGGKRCEMCFSMRLQKSYEKAVADGFDYFTTTLTISPLKDAKLINLIGSSLAEKGGKSTMWLPSDFKKNDGYRQSVELSRKYDLYRQNYCGCIYAEP